MLPPMPRRWWNPRVTSQIVEPMSSGSSRFCSGSEQKCHQTGVCVPIVTAASAGRYFSQALVRRIESGASSSDLHRAGSATPGGSNHLLLSGADLIELSNFTGRDWAHGQGLSVARAPCQGRFRRGTWSWLHAPSGETVRPLCVGAWRVGGRTGKHDLVRPLCVGSWRGAGENVLMAIEISRTEAAHDHTGLPRFAVRPGSLGRIAPPHSRFHRNRELPCIARTEDCRNGQFCATSGVGGCRGRSGELTVGTGLEKVCVLSCCRPVWRGHIPPCRGSDPGSRQPLIGRGRIPGWPPVRPPVAVGWIHEFVLRSGVMMTQELAVNHLAHLFARTRSQHGFRPATRVRRLSLIHI